MDVTNVGRSIADLTQPPEQRTQGRAMGQDDFLKLMIEQMRNQNPLEPQDNSQFFTQIAQFETLDTMREMAKAINALVSVSELSNAGALIGRTVTASVPGGTDPFTGFPRPPEQVTGEVTRISFEPQGAVVHVDDRAIPIRYVEEVA